MLGAPYDATILFSWISEHRWSSFIDNGNEAIWLMIPGVSLILLKIILMLLLVWRNRSMFSTVCKKLRHENRYDQCVPTIIPFSKNRRKLLLSFIKPMRVTCSHKPNICPYQLYDGRQIYFTWFPQLLMFRCNKCQPQLQRIWLKSYFL